MSTHIQNGRMDDEAVFKSEVEGGLWGAAGSLGGMAIGSILDNVLYNPVKVINSADDIVEGAGGSATRVGRWMSEAEYNKMVETGKVQMSQNGNTTYVANPSNPNAFKAAPNGSIYVEFDVPTGSINPAGNANWGQISGPGSLMDRLNQSKGLPPINGMPDATNIKIPGR